MSFETGLQAFKQNKFESAIDTLLVYCKECDAAEKVTSQKYMQAHIGIVKSYQALKQWEQAIAHCQTLTDSQNHPLTIWVDRTLPKLKKAAEKGDQPDAADPQEAKPKQDDNIMLLQQGMAAYKKMQCDRAIQLLEEYVNASTNRQSRNYMQAQMTLVKAYKETKQVPKAIALCNQLALSDNFALKSWASKALPKLNKQLEEEGLSPAEAGTESPETQDNAASDKCPASATVSSKPSASPTTEPAVLKSDPASSSFTFDASSKSTGQPPQNSMDSMSGGLATRPKHTTAQRSTPQRSSPERQSKTSAAKRSSRQPGGSSKLGNNSIAHSGISMVGGAFGSVLGTFVMKRLIRAGVGLAFALIIFVFRGILGIGSDITPLQAAVSEGKIETVKKLVSQGKSLETPDSDGNTVLYWALVADSCGVDICKMSTQQQDIVDLLLDNGAKVTVVNEWQETPLHFAASVNGSQEIIRDILNRGADVNARDAVQMTPLHWAVTYGIDENVEILLNRGADINAKDVDGYTPLDFVMTEKAAQLLESRGAVYGQEG